MSQIKFNLQQQPKDPGYLSCWIPRPGHVWVQVDFSSVEPTVLAQVSKCPNYRKLYGPEAKPNDVYLFVGSKFSAFKDKFLEHYDPENPTPEGIDKTKKLYKFERGVCKEAHLAMQYGAGPPTVHAALTRKEIDIDFEEVVGMHKDYWGRDLFAVVKEYENKLRREWYRNNGWIKNCLGRPLAVDEGSMKDLLNRAIQSTGHDLLMRLMRSIDAGRAARKVPMWPVIVDYHDETIWEVREEAAAEALDIFSQSLKQLNDRLGWEISIRGEPQLAMNLADIKCQD